MRDFLNITESYLESGRAPLYHWTNPESARYILEKGKITASLFGVGEVCLTRDKNLHFNKHVVRIEIDGDEIRHNLKVTPYDYSYQGHSWGTPARKEEREERIHGDVSIRSIKSITLFDNGFAMKNAYWSKQIEAMLANAKAAGIPVTIEDSPHKVQESVEGAVDFFHVTPTSNISSIMAQGLIPQSGDRSQQMGDHGIYLFRSHVDAEDAVMNWLGDELGDEDLTLLRVRLPVDARVTQEAFEVVCHDPIPANLIQIEGEI